MPKDDLKILISAELNTGKSIGDINTAIKGIQQKVNKLRLNVEVNDKVMKTLNEFSKSMEKVQAVSQDLNKAYKEEETVLKKLDGTIEKTTRKHLKSGEIIEKTKKIVNEKTKTAVSGANEENAAIGKLSDRYKSLGEEIKRATFKDGAGKVQGFKKTFDDGAQTRTLTLDASGDNVAREQIIQNFRKIKQEREKLDSALIASQRRVEKEKLESEQKQAKAINENIDLEYKRKQAEELRVKNLGDKKLSNIDNFDRESLERYIRSVYGANAEIKKLDRTFDKAGNEVWKFNAAIDKGNGEMLQYKGSIDRSTRSLHQHGLATQKTIARDLSMLDQFKIALSRVPVWMGAMTLFYGSIRSTQLVLENIISIDTAMTNLRKVMSDSTDFTKVFDDANDSAERFATTIQGALDAYQVAAKAGFGQDDLKFITDAALVTANVGEMSQEQAAESLISTLIQYKKEAKDAMSVIDAWNNISNKNATTVTNLSQGFSKAAATANSFQLSIHELNALIGTVTASTKQSGNEIGNFLKTAMPRLLMGGTQGALKSIGVDFMKNAEEMKSAFDIYEEVAKKFESGQLSNIQQNEVAEALGGKRHISRMTALLNNWKLVEKQMADSTESQGSALRENETYMESLQARINELKRSFEELSIEIGNAFLTNSFIGIVDALTNMAKGASWVSKNVGVLPVLFGTIGVATVVLSSKFKGLVTSLLFVEKGATRSAISLNALKVSLRSFASATAVGAILVGLGFALEKLITSSAKAREEQKKLEQQNKKVVSSWTENQTEIRGMVSEYKELESISQRNTEQEQKYLEIAEKLSSLMPNFIKSLNEKGEATLKNASALQKEIEYTERLTQLEEERRVANAQDNFNNLTKEREKAQRELNKIRQQIETGMSSEGNYSPGILNDEQIRELEFKAISLEQQIGNISNNIQSEFSALVNTINDLSNVKFSDGLAKSVDDLAKNIEIPADKIELFAKDMSDAFVKFNEEADSGNLSKAKKEIISYLNSLGASYVDVKGVLDGLTDSTIKSTNAFYDEEDALEDNVEEVENKLSVTERLLGITNKSIQSIQEYIYAYQLLSNMENLSTEQTRLLAEAKEYLASMFPHLVDGSNFNIQAMIKESQMMEALSKASGLHADGRLSDEDVITLSTISGVQNRIEAYEKEIEALQEVQKQARLRVLAEDSSFTGDLSEALGFIETVPSSIGRIKNEINSLKNERDKLFSKNNLFDNLMGNKSSSTSSKADNFNPYIVDTFANAIADLDLQLTQSKGRMSQLNETSAEYRQELQTQIGILKQKQALSHQEADSLRRENELIQQRLELEKLSIEQRSNLTREYDENQKSIRSLSSSWWDYEGAIKAANQAIQNFMAEQISLEKQFRVDRLEKRFERLNKSLNKLLNPNETFDYSELSQSIADIVAELDLIDKRYINGVSFIDSTDKSRNNLKSIRSEILNIAKEVERLNNSSSNSQNELERLIRSQLDYADKLKDKISDITHLISEKERLYRQEEESLKNQIDTVSDSYDGQIERQRQKLKNLDEEIDKEDRLKKLRQINDELDKVKNDKRFSYITSEGKEILTHNKERVLELEKQRDELLQQYEREDIKNAIQAEIDRLQKAKDDTLRTLQDKLEKTRQIHQAEIDSLWLYLNNLNNLHGLIASNTQEKMNRLKELQGDELEQLKGFWDSLVEQAREGTLSYDELMTAWQDGSYRNFKGHVDDMQSQANRLSQILSSMNSVRSTPPSPSNPLGMSDRDFARYVKNKKDWEDGNRRETAADENRRLRERYNIPSDNHSYDDLKKYHIGGVVGGKSNRVTELANQMFNAKPGEQVIKSLIGELQIPPNNIAQNFIPNMNRLVASIQPKQSQSPATIKHYHFKDLTVKSDNVSDFLKSVDFLITSEG
jgi:TP901 family phage tail tape measure protein